MAVREEELIRRARASSPHIAQATFHASNVVVYLRWTFIMIMNTIPVVILVPFCISLRGDYAQ